MPDQPQVYLNRGNGHLARKEFEAAIRDYDRAVALAPDFALAFKNRGIARTQMGDAERGNADLAKARQIDPRL
jgi:tetratricopeptide (TPR) repeat protein